MDTSKEYIKMCEKAEEIQELAPREDTVKALEDYKSELFYLPRENKIALGHWDNDEGGWMIGNYSDDNKGAIWLPRQDQLQDMVGDKMGFREMLSGIENTYVENMDKVGYGLTWEQLWLAFVMKEKYNKTWNGENWIKQ